VREPKPIKGAKALLFERLVDEDPYTPFEARPFRIYDTRGVLASVQRELMRLLNTRCPSRTKAGMPQDGTILDYGIPDFSYRSAASETDARELARVLENAITAYEPRLRQVHVEASPAPGNQSAVVGVISAMLVVGAINEPVSFPLVLSLKSGAAELMSGEAEITSGKAELKPGAAGLLTTGETEI
jgi:type VI secretion system lysozyme-like protein